MNLFTCPVCAEKLGADGAPLLACEGRTLRCPKNHCFDISAKGYVNLLLSQHKNVKDPGDSKEMAAARSEFLDTGAYKPLLDGICAAVSEQLPNEKHPVILDCGCGECYYTAGVYDVLTAQGASPAMFGVDISKNVLAAAKPRILGRNISLCTASVFRLPVRSCSVDSAMVIFAPFQNTELRRVLKEGGCVVTAIPDKRHLYGLKEILYERPYENEVKPFEIEGFTFEGAQDISYTLDIVDQSTLNALFMMTPYYYKTSPQDSAKLYSWFGTHDTLSTEIAFKVLKYRKN